MDPDNANADLSITISNVSNATLVMSGGTGGVGTTFTFSPNVNFVGGLLFDYQVSDNGLPIAGVSPVGSATVMISPVNDPPAGVPLIQGTVTQGSSLVADVSGISDVDGLGAFSYQWLRGGIAIGGATASTYTLGSADVGYQISVEVYYTDGDGTAEGPVTSAETVQVTSAAAAVVDVPTIIVPVVEDEVLSLPAIVEIPDSETEVERDRTVMSTDSALDEGPTFIGYDPQIEAVETLSAELSGSVSGSDSPSDDADAWKEEKKRALEWLTSQALFLQDFADSESESIVANVSSGLDPFDTNFLDEAGDSDGVSETIATSLRFTSVALTVGALSWAIRAGGLLTSLLVGMPIWREFDPLPVFAQDDDEKKKVVDPEEHVSDEEEAAAYVLEAGRIEKGVRE
jgi:hypothetical protein